MLFRNSLQRPILFALVSLGVCLEWFIFLPKLTNSDHAVPEFVYVQYLWSWQWTAFSLGILLLLLFRRPDTILQPNPTPNYLKASIALFFHVVFFVSTAFIVRQIILAYPWMMASPTAFLGKLAHLVSPYSGQYTIRFRALIVTGFFGAWCSLMSVFYRPKLLLRPILMAWLLGAAAGEQLFALLPNLYFWPHLKVIVSTLTVWTLKLSGQSCTIFKLSPDHAPIVGTCKFKVIIDSQCSGVEGTLFFLLAAAAAFWVDRDLIRARPLKTQLPGIFAFLFVGVITMFALNIFRISALILIGHYIRPVIAMVTWHTFSGMLLYALWIFILFKFFYKRWVLKNSIP